MHHLLRGSLHDSIVISERLITVQLSLTQLASLYSSSSLRCHVDPCSVSSCVHGITSDGRTSAGRLSAVLCIATVYFVDAFTVCFLIVMCLMRIGYSRWYTCLEQQLVGCSWSVGCLFWLVVKVMRIRLRGALTSRYQYPIMSEQGLSKP